MLLKNKHFQVKLVKDGEVTQVEPEELSRVVIMNRADLVLALQGTAALVVGYKLLDTACKIALIKAAK